LSDLEEAKRLLGEAHVLYREAIEMPVYNEGEFEEQADIHIEADAKYYEALSLLEKAGENPKEPNVIIYGHIHGRIWIDKGVFLQHYGNWNSYRPDDYDGPWPFPPDNEGTLTFPAKPPAEEDE